MNPYRHKLSRVHQPRCGKRESTGWSRREMDPVEKPWSPADSATLPELEAKLAAIDLAAKGGQS